MAWTAVNGGRRNDTDAAGATCHPPAVAAAPPNSRAMRFGPKFWTCTVSYVVFVPGIMTADVVLT